MSDYVQIGFILKPHGVKGEIKVSLEDRYFEDFLQVDVVFIEEKGSYSPLFIEGVRSELLITKFEDFDTPEAVKRISSRPMFMRSADILPDEARQLEIERSAYEDCIGFTVITVLGEEIGPIRAIESFPQQEMAIIDHAGREVLLPLVEAFVRTIDRPGRRLIVDIPEGLLDL